ncbi:MAG: hypothetical protein HZC55_22835 [Verrucomicrobia bacterium]|nr:hypothetical protein [Verrucomicrobiota bacterium]
MSVESSTPVLTAPPPSTLVNAGDRAPDVVAFEQAVVGFFVEAADLLAVPKSVAAIYGICFASAEPLSFAEIKSRLDISVGSISQGLRVLRGVGALKEVSGPTDRAERFEPDIELRKLIVHYLEMRVEKQLDGGKKRLRDIRAGIPRGDSAAARTLAVRIKSLEGWHTKSRALMPLVKGALKLG